MKKFLKAISIILCVLIMFTSSKTVYMADKIYIEQSENTSDEKIYCNATLEEDFADNRVLVVLDKNVGSINRKHDKSFFGFFEISNIKDLTEIHENAFTVDEEKFRQIIQLELPTHSKQNVLNVIKWLEKIEGIVYAGPDYIIGNAETETNDVRFNEQTDLSNIQIKEAWDITTGSTDVRVGVIDSGIASHPDLNDNVVEGWDFFNNNNVTTDDTNGHGTHVAGIIGAIGNNGVGIAGIAWNISLVPLQVTYDGCNAFLSDEIEAITYATNNNIPILNYSRGTTQYSTAFKQAVANYPGLFICAAGNYKLNLDESDFYAASYSLSNMISVANVTNAGILAGSSNYGKDVVHLAAPGTQILSTVLEEGYGLKSGTSMAAPHVTGVAALIYSIRPDLSPVEIKELILNNVDEIEALNDKCITGGRLNAYKAVRAATEPQTFTGDVNGDGRSDIILSRNNDGKRALTVYLGKSDGSFMEPTTTKSTRNFFYDDPAFVGDFNGDGLTDIVIHWSKRNYRQLLVYISKGDGTFYEGVNLESTRFHDPLQFPCTFLVADVNGDGKDDFIVHYRTLEGKRNALVYVGTASAPYLLDATTNALESNNTYIENDPVFVGDFNGDGYSDMLVHWVNFLGKRQLLIYKGNSDGTFNTGVNLSSTRDHKPETYPTKFFVADVNGDGKDDFVVHFKNDNGKRCNLVYKGKENGSYLSDASTNALTSTNNYVESDPVFIGDVNGDGRDDMIVQWANSSKKRQLLVYTAKEDGTYNAGVNYSTSNTHNANLYAGKFLVGDVNGDGRDDFIVKWKKDDENRFLTYRGTTTGTFSAAVRTVPSIAIPYYNAE
ncbi:MAG: S8 family serine peptidase [Agathobacter sp.]